MGGPMTDIPEVYGKAYLGPRNVVENDVQRLTVDEFIAARGYIERQLKGANPRSSADFSGAAERLMKLGIIDFRAVDHLLNPVKEPDQADYALVDTGEDES